MFFSGYDDAKVDELMNERETQMLADLKNAVENKQELDVRLEHGATPVRRTSLYNLPSKHTHTPSCLSHTLHHTAKRGGEGTSKSPLPPCIIPQSSPFLDIVLIACSLKSYQSRI